MARVHKRERARGGRGPSAWHAPAGARTRGGSPGGDAAQVDVLQLQRAAGNQAVARLIARQANLAPGNTSKDLRTMPWPIGPWLPDPIDDERIAWIQKLQHRAVIETIDSLGDSVNSTYRRLDAKIDAAKDDANRKKLTEQREALDTRYHDQRVRNRHAFLDYFSCTLGGDAGTQDFFANQLVPFMDDSLIVHRTVAERLEKVRAELELAGIPMPATTVGQSLRGDHTASKRKFDRSSLLIHALGYAIDWHAYRNPNLVDPRLHALIQAVTGQSNRIALPLWGERRAKIKAMGKAAMGQGTAPADQQQFLDLVGTEFDRVKAASESFRTSLPEASKTELAQLFTDLRTATTNVGTANAALAAARRAAKAKPDAVAPAEAAATKAAEELKAKRDEMPAKLERIFKPWRDKIDERVKAMEKDVADLGVDLRKVQPEDWLGPLRAEIQASKKSATESRGRLVKVDADATRAGKDLAALADKVAAFQAWLDDDAAVGAATGVAPDQVAKWKVDVPALLQAVQKSLAGAEALRGQAQAALGGKAPTPIALKTPKPQKSDDRTLTAWRAALTAGDAKLADMVNRFPAAKKALDDATAASQDASTRLSTYEQQNADIKKAIAASKKISWNDLVARRKRLTSLEMASSALISDLDFVFMGSGEDKSWNAAVRNPGVAQLVGAIHTNSTGKGGFFEPSEDPATPEQKAAAATLAKNKKMSRDWGFAKLFYQSMAKHGFDLGAAWDLSQDTMHFELVELVEGIVDPKSCAKPAAAPGSGK
jgi:hypothetical protein